MLCEKRFRRCDFGLLCFEIINKTFRGSPVCELGTWSMRSLVIILRFKQTLHGTQGRGGTSRLDVPSACSVMGRKRSGADKTLPGDPLAAPMAVVPRNIVPPRVSVLQAMCAAAVPDEDYGGAARV